MRHVIAAAAIAALGAGVVAQTPAAFPDVDLHGRLYRSVFQAAPPYLSSGDLAALPEKLRARLSTYLTRRAAFTSAYESKASGFESAASDAKKRALERAIVAVVDAPAAGKLALGFLTDAPIAHEWEGRPDGPAAEAAYAEDYLKRDASSPLAPFLYVFIAHRQRAVFETSERVKDVEGQKAAAKKYRAFIQRARAAADPIYGLIADDMDRQAYVYTNAAQHPRDFNPDG
ncbi:MAG TPA: hypothetical protein VD833_22115 [Vicinamibacterales bacterium]|nr:hypothetical protein [Vicinamibacterales bacterium]